MQAPAACTSSATRSNPGSFASSYPVTMAPWASASGSTAMISVTIRPHPPRARSARKSIHRSVMRFPAPKFVSVAGSAMRLRSVRAPTSISENRCGKVLLPLSLLPLSLIPLSMPCLLANGEPVPPRRVGPDPTLQRGAST